MAKRPLLERMLEKVEQIPIAGCWIWTGSDDGRGYGTIFSGSGKAPKKAHVASYELHHGEIAAGLVVRHKCDVSLCIAPHHLELGTQSENMQDASRRGRLNPVCLKNLKSFREKEIS
jgi:hypothetical protein